MTQKKPSPVERAANIMQCRMPWSQAEAAAEDLRRADLLVADTKTKLTRAQKERAVKELASRLSGISENFAHAQLHPKDFKFGDAAYFNRRQGTLRAALVRLAMARTVD